MRGLLENARCDVIIGYNAMLFIFEIHDRGTKMGVGVGLGWN